MSLKATLTNAVVKGLTHILFRIDADELKKVPDKGPLIVAGNHINIFEAPIIITQLLPRQLSVISKIESWDKKLYAFLFDVWNGIPLRLGEADMKAYHESLKALEEDRILGILPEGTRSHNGRLQKGRPGIILLAIRSGAPILPVAWWGNEDFFQNYRRLKRTDFHVKVGNPFHLDTQGEALSRPVREQITAEIMYQIAALLPSENRGFYSDLENATSKYLAFDEGVTNNLELASPTPQVKAPQPV
jgi:1-acyl-sn-glycerol-3-phosphate acyltransferase